MVVGKKLWLKYSPRKPRVLRNQRPLSFTQVSNDIAGAMNKQLERLYASTKAFLRGITPESRHNQPTVG